MTWYIWVCDVVGRTTTSRWRVEAALMAARRRRTTARLDRRNGRHRAQTSLAVAVLALPPPPPPLPTRSADDIASYAAFTLRARSDRVDRIATRAQCECSH